MPSQELYTQENITILREGDAATLIETLEGEEAWIPHSQIKEVKHHPDGRTDMTMTAWIAKQKGLI